MKKLMRRLAVVFCCAIGLIGLVGMAGCEDEPDAQEVKDYLNSNPWDPNPRGKAYEDLVLDPTEVSMGADDTTAYFSVSGGKEPYTWSVSDISLGTVTGGRADAVYTRNGASVGANIVVVTDSRGYTAVAAVEQTN
ncbi:MAG: hypothetical protein JXR37_11805 [Kiritimatiellae bacterium]|nr:hypothetical protein [Kiritimatiellia bacterium]